jgi:FkbM family methyltransferase
MYLRMFGLGYVKRKITAGPAEGLWLIAGKRVAYSEEFWNGSYEQDLCGFLQRAVPANAVCYDVGANIGYHTLILAQSSGTVYAFEPIPDVCQVLIDNARANDMSNITVVNKVISSESGTVTLVQDMAIDQAGIFGDDPEKERAAKVQGNPLRKTITCDAVTIDEFVAQGNKPPTFIKIDVEGAEMAVLAGARDTLKNHRPDILCETHGRARASAVYEMLAELDYELFCVREDAVPLESVEQAPANMHEGHLLARPKR